MLSTSSSLLLRRCHFHFHRLNSPLLTLTLATTASSASSASTTPQTHPTHIQTQTRGYKSLIAKQYRKSKPHHLQSPTFVSAAPAMPFPFPSPKLPPPHPHPRHHSIIGIICINNPPNTPNPHPNPNPRLQVINSKAVPQIQAPPPPIPNL